MKSSKPIQTAIFEDFLSVFSCSRLCLTYEKSKEYLAKITGGIDQQINVWQTRRHSFSNETNTTYEPFLPKAQRINELALEAIEGRNSVFFRGIKR